MKRKKCRSNYRALDKYDDISGKKKKKKEKKSWDFCTNMSNGIIMSPWKCIGRIRLKCFQRDASYPYSMPLLKSKKNVKIQSKVMTTGSDVCILHPLHYFYYFYYLFFAYKTKKMRKYKIESCKYVWNAPKVQKGLPLLHPTHLPCEILQLHSPLFASMRQKHQGTVHTC